MGKKRGRLIEVEAIFGRLLAFPDDLITRQIEKFGAHARPELAMLLSVIAPGDNVFDLGAHIGTFTIPIAQKTGSTGKVLAIEALPRTFRVLQRNIRRNGVEKIVTALNALAGASNAGYAPVRNRKNSGGTHFEPAGEKTAKAVLAVDIDTLCGNHFYPRTIKIDVEGFEFAALAGSQVIAEMRPILYAEVSARSLGRMGHSIGDLDELLRRHEYRLFRNVAPRNASNDAFEIRELNALIEGGNFFDVLAINRADERLQDIVPPTKP
jgi:FkbM family methyltransferase